MSNDRFPPSDKSSSRRKAQDRLAWLARPVAAVGLFSVGAVLFSGCGRSHASSNANVPVVVRAIEVVPARPPERVHYTGVVRARTESTLGFRVSGKIAERLVDAGAVVQKGQPLLRLDPVDFDLALSAAQAAVEAARAIQIQASLERDRVRVLVEKRAESRDALERATAAAESSAAQVRSAEAQAAQIANQAAYTTLLADEDGVVMTTLSEPGQVIAAGQTVIVLARDGLREAAVDIPEDTMKEITGRKATAQLYADRASVVDATLREVSGVANPISRTYQARYVIDGDPREFPLGATVTVRLAPAGADAQSVVDVPLGSLIDRGDGASVWVIDRGTSTIQKRPVSIVKLGAETARIGNGLQRGDLVVALGAQLLNAGQVVRVAGVSEGNAK